MELIEQFTADGIPPAGGLWHDLNRLIYMIDHPDATPPQPKATTNNFQTVDNSIKVGGSVGGDFNATTGNVANAAPSVPGPERMSNPAPTDPAPGFWHEHPRMKKLLVIIAILSFVLAFFRFIPLEFKDIKHWWFPDRTNARTEVPPVSRVRGEAESPTVAPASVQPTPNPASTATSIPTSTPIEKRGLSEEPLRVTNFWMKVSNGDDYDRVLAILGKPSSRVVRDAVTGQITNSVFSFIGEDSLEVWVFFQEGKVYRVDAYHSRKLAQRPDRVDENWKDVSIGDTIDRTLKRLGGPDGSVRYDAETGAAVNEYLEFRGTNGLSVSIWFESGKAKLIKGEQR
jgi:hypothetical protein